jgi:hypothetical protein
MDMILFGLVFAVAAATLFGAICLLILWFTADGFKR